MKLFVLIRTALKYINLGQARMLYYITQKMLKGWQVNCSL